MTGAREPRAPFVIDSWRVVDGGAIAHERHRARFEDAVRRVFGSGAAPSGGWPDFWDAAREATPGRGEFFPRVSALAGADGEPGIRFELRPAPPRRSRTRLVTAQDARLDPVTKGADLDMLAEARAVAVDAGADDALLLDETGAITEAANGAILGWREGALVRPDTERWLPSVTAGVLAEIAEAEGVRFGRGRLVPGGPEELWYVNALHGISPVTAVDGVHRQVDAERAAHWQALLEARRARV